MFRVDSFEHIREFILPKWEPLSSSYLHLLIESLESDLEMAENLFQICNSMRYL